MADTVEHPAPDFVEGFSVAGVNPFSQLIQRHRLGAGLKADSTPKADPNKTKRQLLRIVWTKS